MPWSDVLVYLIVALALWRVLVFVKPQWRKLFRESNATACGDCGGCAKKSNEP